MVTNCINKEIAERAFPMISSMTVFLRCKMYFLVSTSLLCDYLKTSPWPFWSFAREKQLLERKNRHSGASLCYIRVVKYFLTRVVPSRRQAVHWIDPVPSRGETGEPLVLTACMYMTIVPIDYMSYMYKEVSVAKVILFYFTLLEELGGQHFLGIFVDNAHAVTILFSLSTPFVILV